MASVTDLSSRPELASALHRLRSTLARAKAELELAAEDGEGRAGVAGSRVLGDLREALELLGAVESAAFSLVRIVVLDDDVRLGELTARSLRRLGYDAEARTSLGSVGPREVVVFDLGLAKTMDEAARDALRSARPIVVTGATDPASRATADALGAAEYLVKPVEPADLAAAIERRVTEGWPPGARR